MNPTISCNALVGITTPQTIKIEGQIKKKKVIVLIDSGSTHNFIHCRVATEQHRDENLYFENLQLAS